MLLGNGTFLSRTNQIFRRLPSDPRCKLCHAPYGGVAGPIMKLLGYGKYPANPQLCNACFRQSVRHPGGAQGGRSPDRRPELETSRASRANRAAQRLERARTGGGLLIDG